MDTLTVRIEKGDREVIAGRLSSSSDGSQSSSSSSSGASSSSSTSSGSSSSTDTTSSTSSPAPLEYSDISDEDLPPPAPAVPHPDIVAELRLPKTPEPLFIFETSGSIPVRMLSVISTMCGGMRSQILTELSERSKLCSTRQDFLTLVQHLLQKIDGLVKTCRKAAVDYHRYRDTENSVVNRRKFSVYKRVAVWRDGIRMVIATVRTETEWSERIRQKFWRRLLLANRNSFYCCNMVSTFPAEDLIN